MDPKSDTAFLADYVDVALVLDLDSSRRTSLLLETELLSLISMQSRQHVWHFFTGPSLA